MIIKHNGNEYEILPSGFITSGTMALKNVTHITMTPDVDSYAALLHITITIEDGTEPLHITLDLKPVI